MNHILFDIPRLIAILAAILLLLVVVAAMSYETTWDPPEPQPSISAMDVGGERAIDDEKHWLLGIAFGGVIILVFSSCLLLAPETRRSFTLRVSIGATSVLFLAVFVAMMISYRDYATSDEPTLLGPFPAPTTLMLFGVWCLPMVFAAIYSLGFNRWFADNESVDDDDLASSVGDAN